MVKFIDKPFVSDSISPKVSKIKLKTISGIGMLNVYFITLSLSGNDIFDIYSSTVFKQRGFRKSNIIILGIADGYDAALEIVNEMISECLVNTKGDLDIRKYYENYIKEHI